MELRSNSIVKVYKDRMVVKGVDIHVKSGEIVGLLGPNGAGKTTTFYMMVGLTVILSNSKLRPARFAQR